MHSISNDEKTRGEMYSEFWTKFGFNPVRTKMLCYTTRKRTNENVMYVVKVEIRYNEQYPC